MSPENTHEKWKEAKASEIDFWQHWLNTNGGEWPEEFKQRMDPRLPLQDYITQYLDTDQSRVRILDVGAGPATVVGKSWPGHEVDLVAVDALGDEYKQKLTAAGVQPPVITGQCPTETLSEKFDAESFDLVHVRNALDHGYDPFLAMREMLRVVKRGGHLLMFHFANEAENASYDGFHQWNFCVENGDLVVWNRSARDTLKSQFAGLVEIVSISPDGDNWVGVVLRKR